MWFMVRLIIAWIIVYLNKIFNSDALITLASNICKKEYIFNTPFGKYIWASLYWYTQMVEDYEIEIKNIVDKISEKKNDSKDVLINIWANIWRWAIYLSYKYWYDVIAFEPSPETYYRFKTNICFSWLDSRFETYNIWLWNQNWIMKFEYNIKSNWCAHIIEEDDNADKKDIINISVKKFDDLWIDKEKIKRVWLIIMDVEWFELNVLRWMEKTLKNLDNIQIICEIREWKKDKKETLKFMENIGYTVKQIDNENYLFKK